MAVLTVLAGLSVLVWLWLTLLRGMFWRTDVRLPAGADPSPWPSVVVVIPARDEAEVLPASLPSLVAQDYPGPVRVILVDDNSSDSTGTLVAGRWPEVNLITPGEPMPGWTGKLWALRAGIAQAGPVEFLLLTDADIAHRPGSLTALVRAATANQLDLVSQMARLRVRAGWERLILPAFVYFFVLLYPFRWVNRPRTRTAAAAGGCSLVRRAALERAGGLDAIRDAVIDDVALARLLKRCGSRIFLGLADLVGSVRPYDDLASLWRMVSRSAYAQLRHSPGLLAGTTLGLAVVFAVPPVATMAGAVFTDWPTLLTGAAAWLLMAGTFTPMLRYYDQPVTAALLLPFTAVLYLAMTVDSAIQHHRGRGAAWKGRTYPAPER
ncbi:MAG TPA: glycosyltransferase [Micromonosporaceae bacterium]|jgi:hopene-associated glycosyltransferase HpnB